MSDSPEPDLVTAIPLLRELNRANEPGQMPLAEARSRADSCYPGRARSLLDDLAAVGLIVLDGEGPYQWVRITDAGRRVLSGNGQASLRHLSDERAARRASAPKPGQKRDVARPSAPVWCAIAAAFIAGGGAFVGLAGTLYKSNAHRPLWTSTPMTVSYILFGLGAVCLACAVFEVYSGRSR